MVPSQRIFGPGGAGVLFYATSARTQHYFPFPAVQFHLASPQKSCPVPPTSEHLPIHLPGCLYKLQFLHLPPELCVKPSCPKCCVDNLVLYRCLSDLAQLSFHWISGHCDICPNEITDLVAKTNNGIPYSSLPLGLLVSAYP